jgi:negative regulator of flagellin synthesis FlgM
MKITHNKVGQNLNLSDVGKADKANNPKGSAVGSDPLAELTGARGSNDASTVSLSERSQDVLRAKQLAMAAPDVREDRVAELQKAIDSGKYKVDAKDIADKMVDEESQWA